MKTIQFLIGQIQSHKIKSLSFTLVIILIVFLGYGVFWVYQNITSAVSYYSSIDVSNPKRVEISNGGNIFDFLSKGGGGLSNETIQKIKNDPRLESIQSFTLIPYPVTGDFSVFSFNLESDIPVFAVSNNSRLGEKGVGISRKMLEYYNLQFAGSSPLFPKIDEAFIRGKKVVITVGKSKIFNLGDRESSEPISSEIVDVNPDYPGFGIVLPRAIIEKKLKEIGLSLGTPFKIVGTVKDTTMIEAIRKDYSGVSIQFDYDIFKQNAKKLKTITLIFGVVFLVIILIVGTIILFLLGSILREISNIYRLIYRLGILNAQSFILTLGEPIILTLLGGIIGSILNIVVFSKLSSIASKLLPERGILFTIIDPNLWIIILYALTCIFIIICILFFYNWRQLRKYRIPQ